MVHGISVNGVRAFLGVPYAEPPVGDLRFAAPRAVAPYGELDASQAAPNCAQRPTLGEGMAKDSAEDCLNLNVWTPSDPGEPLPVMVWFHGGGFEIGSAHADGGYAGDHIVNDANDGALRFAERIVVLDSRQVDTLLALPL